MQNSRTYPLLKNVMRTHDDAFEHLPDYPWPPCYVNDLACLDGLRMHYLDVQSNHSVSSTIYLCLHGNPAWSYLYRKMIPVFIETGARVVAPDMVGFGKSDKPTEDNFHTFEWHRQCLLEFVERLDLRNVVIVVQDWGGILGLTLPMAAAHRYKGLVVMNTTLATGQAPLTDGFKAWRQMCDDKPDFDIARLFARSDPTMTAAECAAYMAPYPNPTYRAATRAFPRMVPEFEDSDGAEIGRAALDFWRNHWSGTALMAIGAQDPVLGTTTMQILKTNIRNCSDPMVLNHAGHFVQEQGDVIARYTSEIFG